MKGPPNLTSLGKWEAIIPTGPWEARIHFTFLIHWVEELLLMVVKGWRIQDFQSFAWRRFRDSNSWQREEAPLVEGLNPESLVISLGDLGQWYLPLFGENTGGRSPPRIDCLKGNGEKTSEFSALREPGKETLQSEWS